MIKAAVVGATGYTGEELVEVLLKNDAVKLTSLSAIVEKETQFSKLYPKFGRRVSLVCKNLNIEEVSALSDVVFLALPHTVSMEIAPAFLKNGKKVIDLSADYRLPAPVYEKWYSKKHADPVNLQKAVYGLPELNRDKIKNADLIANPGCYPTGIILGLLPIAKKVQETGAVIIIDAKSGVTGAGRKASIPLLFGEVDENLKCYKPNEHQHMPEIEHVLSCVTGKKIEINFIPHLIPMKRGILSTIYLQHKKLTEAEKIYAAYENFFKHEPFVRVRPLGTLPEIKDVVGTNFCDIGIKVSNNIVIIVSVIDNLLKGASGQAVQNMNIMMGIPESTGFGIGNVINIKS